MPSNATATLRLPPINEDNSKVDSVLAAFTKRKSVIPTQASGSRGPSDVTRKAPSGDSGKLPPLVRDEEFDFSDDEEPPQKQSRWLAGLQNIPLKTYTNMCQRLKVHVRANIVRQLEAKEAHISLRRLDMPGPELRPVYTALIGYHRGRTLDLTGNRIKPDNIGHLNQLLSENRNFTSIILAENCMGGMTITNFVMDMTTLTFIHDLDLSSCQITDLDADALEKLITKNERLVTLTLSRNELRLVSAQAIGRALANNKALEVLDMSWNHLRGAGAIAIANSLMHNDSLTSLALSWNGFGYEGCSALGHVLTHNTSLTYLDLSNNRIHPHALFTLLKGVCQNEALEVLKLGDNPIPAVYTSPLLVKLSKAQNSALTYLDLSGVVVDDQFESLLDKIQVTRALQVQYGQPLPVHRSKWVKREAELRDAPRIYNIDPVRMLYHTKKNLRCIDFLLNMDKDESFDLTRTEIMEAVKKNGLQLSSSAMDCIMDYLDTNKDGRVDLLELIAGERKLRRRLTDMNRSHTNIDPNRHSETFGGRSHTALDDTLYDLVEKARDPEAKLVRSDLKPRLSEK